MKTLVTPTRIRILGVAALATVLAGCSFPASAPTPDVTATAIAQTIVAMLTPTVGPPTLTSAPPTPTVEPTATVPAPSATAGPAGCTDRVGFVSDVTIPDNTLMAPGATFVKTWRLRNDGTCTWSPNYALVFAGGNSMGDTLAVPIGRTVAPGASLDLSITLTAPTTNGVYWGNWQLRNTAGGLFGLGSSANQAFWVQIVVGATPTGDPNAWRGEYFANRTLSGTPSVVRNDRTVDFNWGRGPAITGLAPDDFSIRWTRRVRFSEGLYRFRLLSDDGARFFLDGQRILDQWTDGAAREITVDIYLRAGDYDLKVEYYERGGDARVGLRWETVADSGYPEWRGQYWPAANFGGRWSVVRNDRSVDFDWANGAPASGIPADGFTARWTRTVTLEPGTYRLSARADDGVRVLVDGVVRIDEWHDSGGSVIYTADVTLGGTHRFQVDYYERGGGAKVSFAWAPVANTSTPTQTPTATETPTATPTSTATPTATVEPTAVPGTTLVYDFVARACSAAWTTSGGLLACPAGQVDVAGYVMTLSDAVLENDAPATAPALLTQPPAAADAWIEGVYGPLAVQSGDRLRATIGCLQGRSACSARFTLGYLTAQDGLRGLTVRTEVYDGQLTEVDLDLASLVGQTVSFVLRVEAVSPDSPGSAVWVSARIVR